MAMQLALQQYKVNVIKIMAHPLQLQILELLCEGPKGINEHQSLLRLALFIQCKILFYVICSSHPKICLTTR